MPFCINCGQELVDGARFCSRCGTSTTNNNNSKRRSVYDGIVHKCPNCGESLNSFITNCPSCGYEIRDAASSEAVQIFASQLANANTHQKKVSIIRNFPIPNTKEDIYEFMILAYTNIGENLENDISLAWQAKTEQAYQKAQIICDETDLLHIEGLYIRVRKKFEQQKKTQRIKNTEKILDELMPVFPNVIVVTGWQISVFVLIPMCGVNLDEAGANLSQLILIMDLVAGAKFIPLVLRSNYSLPKLITSLGLILSNFLMIPLCRVNLDSAGFNAYQLLLIVDIICSVVIFKTMFIHKNTDEGERSTLNGGSFVIALIALVIYLMAYGISCIKVSQYSENYVGSPTIEANSETNDDEGIYSYEVRNYIGKNVASIGKDSLGFQVDEYGRGELRLVFVTETGIIIPSDDVEFKKQYSVVGQSISAGTNLIVVHRRDSRGKPYSSLVDYQSYDEIMLYVAPIGDSSYNPSITELLPTQDRHIYHIRDYVGRNAAAFGKDQNGIRIDEYGAGELRITFSSEDGSYVDLTDINILKEYMVVAQDIAPNKELKLEYEKDSQGKEYDNLVRSQNYEEINLTVRKIDASIVS